MDRTNRQWVDELCSAGHRQDRALKDLRHTLLKGLRATQKHIILDEAALEDVVQESFIKILKNLPRFEGRSSFVTWAMAIAIHEFMSWLRSVKWKNASIDDINSASLPPQLVAEEDVEVRADHSALLSKIEILFDTVLTPLQKFALKAELKGMPLTEVARRINSNRNAVYKLTHDARKKLKKELLSSVKCRALVDTLGIGGEIHAE